MADMLPGVLGSLLGAFGPAMAQGASANYPLGLSPSTAALVGPGGVDPAMLAQAGLIPPRPVTPAGGFGPVAMAPALPPPQRIDTLRLMPSQRMSPVMAPEPGSTAQDRMLAASRGGGSGDGQMKFVSLGGRSSPTAPDNPPTASLPGSASTPAAVSTPGQASAMAGKPAQGGDGWSFGKFIGSDDFRGTLQDLFAGLASGRTTNEGLSNAALMVSAGSRDRQQATKTQTMARQLGISEDIVKNADAKTLGSLVLQQLSGGGYDFQQAGDKLYRVNKRTGSADEVAGINKPPSWGVIGQDEYGNNRYGWINPSDRTVTPGSGGTSSASTGALGPAAIPPAPSGVDPKVWREQQTKRLTDNTMPASSDDVSSIRKEVLGLPSYKNLAQAMPIYQSMSKAAGNSTRASDLDLVYGLAKVLDPGSVVREGETLMVSKTASLPDWIKGQIDALNGGAVLQPQTRKDLMAEAYGRMQGYQGAYDQDTQFYKGVASRRKVAPEDILPTFQPLTEWNGQPNVVVPPSAAGLTRADIEAELRRRGKIK